MSIVSTTTLKTYFNTGDYPTEANFADLIDTLADSPHDITVFETVDAMRAEDAPTGTDSTTAITKACDCAYDGGGGVWTWDADETATDNTGIYVKPADVAGAGRWVRLHTDNRINVKWFGACGVLDVDYTTEIDAALAYLKTLGGGELYFPIGTYDYTGTLKMSAPEDAGSLRLSLIGEAPGATKLPGPYEDQGKVSWLRITPEEGGDGYGVQYEYNTSPSTRRGGAIRIENIVIETLGAFVTKAIYMYGLVNYWSIRHVVWLTSADSLTADGLYIDGTWAGLIENCKGMHRAGVLRDEFGDVVFINGIRRVNGQTGAGFTLTNSFGDDFGGPENQIAIINLTCNHWGTGWVFGDASSSDYINSDIVLGGAVQLCNVGVKINGVEGVSFLNVHIEQIAEKCYEIGALAPANNVEIRGGKLHNCEGIVFDLQRGVNVMISSIYLTDLQDDSVFVHVESPSQCVLVENCRCGLDSSGPVTFLDVESDIGLLDRVVLGMNNRFTASATNLWTNKPNLIHAAAFTSAYKTTTAGTDLTFDADLRSCVTWQPGSASNIKYISNGFNGQRLSFVGGNGNGTLTDKASGDPNPTNGNIKTWDANDYAIPASRVVELVKAEDGIWYQYPSSA